MKNDAKGSDRDIHNLCRAVLNLETLEECMRFFEDLCTIQELKAMSQRLEVATLLRQGGTYHEIAEKTGASTATISRVNRSLIYGAHGYTVVLDRLEAQEEDAPEAL